MSYPFSFYKKVRQEAFYSCRTADPLQDQAI